jgi:hypothetical protein
VITKVINLLEKELAGASRGEIEALIPKLNESLNLSVNHILSKYDDGKSNPDEINGRLL